MKYFNPFLLLLFVSFFANAQSKEIKVVSNTVEELRQAMLDSDKINLERLTSDSLSYGHSSGRMEGKIEFIENIVSGKSDFVTIDLSEQTISIKGNVAIVRHVLSAAINDGGKPGDVKLKVLLVLEKEKGRWKLLARQAVKLVG